MRKGNKIVGIVLSAVLVLAMFCNTAFAEESGQTKEDNLVVLWDFDGETDAEKLSDKAPSGTVKDTLTVNAPEKTTLESGYAYLKEGGLNIALSAPVSADANQNGKQTIFVRFLMEDITEAEFNHEGQSGDKGHQEIFNQRDSGLFFQVVRYQYATNADWVIDTKTGTQNNGGWSSVNPGNDFWTGFYGQWVEMAVVLEPVTEGGNLIAKYYVNLTGNTADAADDFVKIHEFDTGMTALDNQAVTRLGGYVGEGDWAWSNGHTKFDDVRIYDTALSVEELVGVSNDINNAKAPKTGDNEYPVLMITVCLIAAGALFTLVLKRRNAR